MAKRILLTNAVFDSTEALKIGLIDKVITTADPTDEHLYEELQKEARNMGLDISKKNPVATRTMLQTLRQQEDEHFGNGLETSIRREAYAQALCYARSDWGEGIKAVIERRSPVFKGYHEK
jgi:enoyl-CoA hydratase/carnithine racemase